ncbi:MAG: ABC transporter substrate-binding protein [Gammaproteobacteria bacterium]|nr:ABC transporter substrate-binding protein [Gammaproteobacteria bacterium]
MKRLVIFAISLLLLSGLFGCGQEEDGEKPAAKDGLREITIAQFGHVFIYMPLYVAIEGGFFEEQGLKVNLINGGGDEKTFAAVASGQAQFGVADPTFAAIARERGQPGIVVGTVVSGAPFWGVARNRSKITALPQLKDLRIATYSAPSTNYALINKTLRDNAEIVGNAKVVQGAFGGLLAMLEADLADIAMVLEPTVSLAVAAGAEVVFSYPEHYGKFFLTGLYTLEATRDSDPELVQKAVNALDAALGFSHENPGEVKRIAQRMFPELSENIVSNAIDRMLLEGTMPRRALIDPEGWEKAIAVRLANEDLQDESAAKATVDNSFAERAHGENSEPAGEK